MDHETTYLLEDLIFDLTEIQSSDVLAHVDLNKIDIYPVEDPSKWTFPLDARWNALLKIAVQNKRQSDTHTLCLAIDGIEWEYKGKKVVSPLWLVPVSWKINKVKQEIELAPDFEQTIFNPFVKNQLKRQYDLFWDERDLSQISHNSTELYDFLRASGLRIATSRFSAYGNFHHHRYQIVKDLEALTKVELNALVQEMLGDHDVRKSAGPIELTKQNIVASDKDQQQVFEKVAQGNLVIQGPPGTGKSQVLTNLLAKLLHKGGMSLVVSEKKSALEVLVKKLSDHGLDAFTFISHNQGKPSDFIARLKGTWNLLETNILQPRKNLLLSEQLIDQLQLTLDRLASKELIGGVDLQSFQELVCTVDLSEVPYRSDVPTMAEWLAEKEHVERVAQEISSFEILKHFRQKGLRETLALDQVLGRLHADFQALAETLAFETFAELEKRIAQISRSQILENESYKKYAKLFSSPRERKKFGKLKIAFQREKEAFALLETEKHIWKKLPSLSLIHTWKQQLSESWWKRRKAEKQIRAQLLPDILPAIAIENWLKYLEAEAKLQALNAALLELGIERPDLELSSIQYLLDQLEKEESNELNQAANLSPTLRKALIDRGSQLQQCYRDLSEILAFEHGDHVIATIENAIQNLPEIIKAQQPIKLLSKHVYRLLQQFHSVEMVEKLIFKSNWTQFESRFPELAKFDGAVLKSALEKIISQQAEEHEIFGKNLVFAQHQKFEAFHQLLRTPGTKLKAEEKVLKAKLKTGKSLLVKEFGKTKQHKTIRELLDSEARAWIELLTPIWLSTPTQVASSFPMETDLFECVIFDEASQVPLSHALGSLQRARRAVVAGDEQQMSPGSYFSGNRSATDLLHQASYHWPKSPLRHHYRSIHPELIAFSNRFFYDNELIVYPSANRDGKPVQLHFVPDAVYDGRQNVTEAQTVALHIEKYVDQADSLGIVAFSEQQLDCIWKQLSAQVQHALTQRLEDGTAFFKALEQVQGDECDRLIISFGYGKNPDGTFHLRFGPLNQKSGSKRLNVLFSRAIKSIDFYTSIQASDLALSTNEAINLLRFFMLETANDNRAGKIAFPFDLDLQPGDHSVSLLHVSEKLKDAQELVVLFSMLNKRGWQMKS